MKLTLFFVFMSMSAFDLSTAGKVLFYMPFISESVKITFMPVAKELASRGHSVTIVTPFPGDHVKTD
jgi:hypothetical protein